MSKDKNLDPMRGLYLRGRVWWYQPPTRDKLRGVPVSLETRDAIEAQKLRDEIQDHPELNPSAGLTDEIAAFVAYKLRMRHWTASTAKKGNMLTAFAKGQPEHRTAANITGGILQQYHDDLLAGGLSDTTVHGYMMTFRSFFNWAVEVRRIMRRNPVDEVKVVRTEGKARPNFADYKLRDRLIAEAPTEDLRFILYAGFHWGLRKKEIIEARPFWFDLDAGMLHLRKTATMQFKDREERSIPMTRQSVAFMRRYKLREPFVLRPDVAHRKSLYRYDFRLPFEKYMAAQKVPWLTTHIMRHTFASLLASSGVSILKIATWLGDDVSTVQKHYAKLLPGDQDIEKAFGDRHKVTAGTRRGKAGRSTRRAS